MNLIRMIYANAKRPDGFAGRLMAKRMNGGGHRRLALWGLGHLQLGAKMRAADLGCGGGGNIARLLEMIPEGKVCGLDYSAESVRTARETNRKAIREGRCKVVRGNVRQMPFPDSAFDLVTAFETIYFWPEIEHCFREVWRITKRGGRFMIVNESDGKNDASLRWTNIIDGMRIYTAGELERMLVKAGFSDIVVDDDEEGDRLCVIARRP